MAGMEALLWQMAQKQAQQFNTSPTSRFVNDAGAEAGGKLNAAGQSFLKAIMAPGNALRGEYDEREIRPDGSVSQFDPRMMDDATELAGTIGLSSMPVPKPAGSLGMFGGASAKTADHAALARAQALESSGAPRDAIWNDTGWFKGADGQWRFEIDDSASAFNGLNAEPQTTPMRSAIKHPSLYQAYPDVISIQAREATLGNGNKGVYYGPELGEAIDISWSAPDKRSVMLHELQHAIQQREGFSGGGNSRQFKGDTPNPAVDIYRDALNSSPELAEVNALRNSTAMQSEIQKSNELWRSEYQTKADALEEIDTPEAMAQLDALFEQFNQRTQSIMPTNARVQELSTLLQSQGIPLSKPADFISPTEAYQRIAGEVEARNVQTRMNMTPEQRKAQAPWLTQDVPDKQQIIRMLFGN